MDKIRDAIGDCVDFGDNDSADYFCLLRNKPAAFYNIS